MTNERVWEMFANVNRRKAERRVCNRVAKIQFGTGNLPRDCMITDISAGGVKVIWFSLLELPDLVSRDLALFERLRTWHHWLAWTLMALLALHVAAVLRHDVLRRDGIFRRMSPFTR